MALRGATGAGGGAHVLLVADALAVALLAVHARAAAGLAALPTVAANATCAPAVVTAPSAGSHAVLGTRRQLRGLRSRTAPELSQLAVVIEVDSPKRGAPFFKHR